jgi:hypothetical protein
MYFLLFKEIMSSQKFLNKGEVYDPLLPWLGEGLLTAQGDIGLIIHSDI